MASGIDPGNPAKILESFGVTEKDLEEIRRFSKVAAPRIDDFISAFYDRLMAGPEFPRFFPDRALLERVQREQRAYWLEFLDANIDDSYIIKRQKVGELHGALRLPVELYLRMMNFSLGWFADHLAEQRLPAQDQDSTRQSLVKLANLDAAVVLEALAARSAEVIAEQSRAIMELSTPIIKVWDEILLLPLIGVIDTLRAQQIIEQLLHSIVETESRVVILDVTGVPTVDTNVAQHLMRTVAAAKMLGAEAVVTGISPDTAQTLVRLNIDLTGIRTRGTLWAGVDEALRLIGKQVTSR